MNKPFKTVRKFTDCAGPESFLREGRQTRAVLQEKAAAAYWQEAEGDPDQSIFCRYDYSSFIKIYTDNSAAQSNPDRSIEDLFSELPSCCERWNARDRSARLPLIQVNAGAIPAAHDQ